MARASDQQVREFLTQVLQQDTRLAAQFEWLVAPRTIQDNLGVYRDAVRTICEAYMDDDFIGYDAAGDFEAEMTDFIQTNIQLTDDQQQLAVAFKQLAATVVILANIEIDDSDGEMMRLDQECRDIWERMIQQVHLPLQREIFSWLQRHANASLMAFEGSVTDLIFTHFTAPEFMRAKMMWTQARQQQAEQQADQWDAEKWATRHVQTMIDLGLDRAELDQFCTANAAYAAVRQAYIDYCLQRQDYSTALQQLTAGKHQAQDDHRAGLVSRYSRQLKDLYHRLGRSADYQQELWQLVTVYDPANLQDFRELKQLYATTEWPAQRQRLFKALPQSAEVAPLYAEEGLLRQLLQVVLKSPGLGEVQAYEQLLKPKFSHQLLEKYVAVAEQMASHTGTRQHYRQIVRVLNQMTAYPLGLNTAQKLIRQWRTDYPRRSAMLEELTKFKG